MIQIKFFLTLALAAVIFLIFPTLLTIETPLEGDALLLNSTRVEHSSLSIPSPRKLMLVHVGKTGGESVKSVLQFGCQRKMNKQKRQVCYANLPKSEISNRVKSYFHCYSIRPKHALHPTEGFTDGFVFIVRHPLLRARSWYRYVHPDHCRKKSIGSPSCGSKKVIDENPEGVVATFFQCFPDMQDWAESLSPNKTDACSQLAWTVVQGKIPKEDATFAHMTANFYDYVANSIVHRPGAPVYVIRTDTLWSDLKTIDRMLGGTGSFGELEDVKVTHGSQRYWKGSSIGTDATKSFCCALYDEIHLYLHLISKSENLSPTEKIRMRQDTFTTCGFESSMAYDEACLYVKEGRYLSDETDKLLTSLS